MRCPACSSGAPEGSRYCPFCAAPLETSTSAPTATRARSRSEGPDSSSDRTGQARYLPGAILARRYRIVGPLGRGGMGEVYRADDLKLGRPVALKFLPRAFDRDKARLDRFLNEVQVALRVTHPNVCRVHDVGEAEGQHFISMEYVDGEDLASLLRRIGRLPQDKAVQIARQLCAGLSAAHEEGVLHRDLKPANVMIDGRGRAKITDFGLAGIAESFEGDEIRAGTPFYMAPEQREGREVTIRSDVYSLGLVLYELFTGRRAFEAESPADLIRLQRESTPTNPSAHVRGLDETVERAILRCLEREPRRRPASALAVAAALPGGDPLAAALAAGETPSPEMVADAGDAGGLHPAVGALLLAAIVAVQVVIGLFYHRQFLVGRVTLDVPPEALSMIATGIIGRAGDVDPPADSVYGFSVDRALLEYVGASEAPRTRWNRLSTIRPAPLLFWYRQSPDYLVASDLFNGPSFVTPRDPPWDLAGMAGVWLDPRGELVRLQVVPPRIDDSPGAPGPPDWQPFFEAAGLDPGTFVPGFPASNPLLDCDHRQAWDGAYPGQPDVPIHVEAGSRRGRAAYFEVVPPWREYAALGAAGSGTWDDATFYLPLLVALLVGGPLLARRNLRRGRGDRRGATRLAVFVFLAETVWWVLRADHVPALGEVWLFFQFLGYGLVVSGLTWVVYVALEPYARRMWPDALISWSRLLAGRFRDPRVGRDILIGALGGSAVRLWWLFHSAVVEWLGLAPEEPRVGSLSALAGVRQALSEYPGIATWALCVPIGWLFIILLVTRVVRRRWIALVVVVLFGGITVGPGTQTPWLTSVFMSVAFGWGMVLLARFGALAGVFFFLYMWVVSDLALPLDPSAWYAGRSFLSLGILAALAGYGYWISRAGRTLLPADPLTD